jgi:hypothetical protein
MPNEVGFNFPPPIKPAPEGVSIVISEVWMKSLTGSDFNSLTDPHTDETVITVSLKDLEQFGSMGDDKINFKVSAALAKIGYRINMAVAVAWDPLKYPNAALLYQSDLKASQDVEDWVHRTPYLPKYRYMFLPGEHELVIMCQMRTDENDWTKVDGTFTKYTEFARIGEITMRRIKIVITE